MGESAALKERKNMNCRIAEGMVNKYIDHTLPLNDLEDFLEHIEKCSSCYDELATYFIVHKAMQQLDEKQEDTVLDFCLMVNIHHTFVNKRLRKTLFTYLPKLE